MPCNIVNFILVNRESEVRRGRQQGEETRKKERSKVKKAPGGKKKKCGGSGGHWLPAPRIRQSPAMSGWMSLCAGMEVLARVELSTKAARRKTRGRGLRGACAALL